VGVALLDSSVVAGFLDPGDALHQAADEAVRRLVRERMLAISAVTYAEILTGVRLEHHGDEEVRGFVADLIGEVVSVNDVVAERAAELRADDLGAHRRRSRPPLRLPDALILATAELHPEIDLLVTGDGRWARIAGLRDVEIELLTARRTRRAGRSVGWGWVT
jgi:predicted nucleic acid-binding protein